MQLIRDRNTGKSRGFGYVEFPDVVAAERALMLRGQKIGRGELVVQPSQGDKNRTDLPVAQRQNPNALAAAAQAAAVALQTPVPLGGHVPSGPKEAPPGSIRLFVGNMDSTITDETVHAMFRPFGTVDKIDLVRDEMGNPKGFGFVRFTDVQSGVVAVHAMNGQPFNTRTLKVEVSSDSRTALGVPPVPPLPPGVTVPTVPPLGSAAHPPPQMGGPPSFPPPPMGMPPPPGGFPSFPPPGYPAGPPPGYDPTAGSIGNLDDDGGVRMNAASRQLLMAKLQRDTPVNEALANIQNMGNPEAVQQYLQAQQAASGGAPEAAPEGISAVPTGCLLLRNMFDPAQETDPNFDLEIQEDVGSECAKFGQVQHIFVDKTSKGNVYLKFSSSASAAAASSALHGRLFAGLTIAASFLQYDFYASKFPDSVRE